MSVSPGQLLDRFLSGARRLVRGVSSPAILPSRFQGETLGFRLGRSLFFLRDRLKAARRRTRQFVKAPRTGLRLMRFRTHVERREWDQALREAEVIATIAERQRDGRLMEEMGLALVRLGVHGRSNSLRLESRRLRNGFPAKEWKGGDLSGRTLLVDLTEDGTQALATTRLVAEAAAHARRCIVLAEPRLVPLVRRSFPGVETRPAGIDDAAALAEADVFATAHHLAAYFWTDPAAIEASFRPLTPDPALVAAFRRQYRSGGGKPLVGLSWGSAAYAKDLPPLAAWPPLLRAVEATFVSLQYGRIDNDLAQLRESSGCTILHDESVDQLVDMDRFAAQIAALDAVVTISNTGAHLTGALGVPAVVIIDDRFRRIWPVASDRTPWYPRAVMTGKRGRPWSDVMDEAAAKLAAMLAPKPRE